MAVIGVRLEMLDSSGGQAQTQQLVTPSPRSWERVSRVLQSNKDQRVRSLAVTGLVGEGVAVQFLHTLEEIGQLPPIEKLIRMRPQDAARQVPETLPSLYGLTYSLVRYSTDLSHFERSIELLNAMSELGGDLPRREIQALGMELLLGKAERTNLFAALTSSSTYLNVYRGKALAVLEGQGYDPQIWNIACDVVINQAIRNCHWCVLPKDACLPEHCLPATQLQKRSAQLWTAEEIYSELKRDKDAYKKLLSNGAGSFICDLDVSRGPFSPAAAIHVQSMEEGIWRERLVRPRARLPPGAIFRPPSAPVPHPQSPCSSTPNS